MPDAATSLLAGGVQADLIPLEDMPDEFFLEEEKPGVGTPRYTAERFFAKRPGDYRTCVSMIASGLGMLQIARLLKVHHMTVAAVRSREGERIDIEKERTRRNLRLAVAVGCERLPEIMATLPAGQVPISTAILIDKLRDMDGEPTQRIEVTHKASLTHEALAASLNAFPDAIEVQTSTPDLPTHQAAAGSSTKALIDPLPSPSDAVASDSVSGSDAT